MQPNTDRINYLLDQYVADAATEQETRELFMLLKDLPDDSALKAKASQIWTAYTRKETRVQPDWETMYRQVISTPVTGHRNNTRRLWIRIAAAASVVIIMGVAAWFMTGRKPAGTSTTQPEIAVKTDISAPDKARAVITLSNGQQIFLDSAGNGTLATQGKVQLAKHADGQLVYTGSSNEILYNTLNNPRGSKVVNLTLGDGTKVWLNSESSVRYPVAFNGDTREVDITGEAYFEVAKDASKKFLVRAGESFTEVLGTHFNINSYSDEQQIKITLLEGSVKVSKNAKEMLLTPGQQAQVANNISLAGNVNLEQVMAWKNGLFSFDNADLSTVMRQISRWYNVEISYAGAVPQGRFKGEIPMELTLSQLLQGLSSTRINFKVEEGNKITILP